MSPAGGVVIRRMTTLLTDKHAIVYGGGGSLGGGIARTFAREGATVHLAGRTREPLERSPPTSRPPAAAPRSRFLDAFDEPAVDEHPDAVAAQAGR
jgi:NAD(P)-dependent dehydrogenase (short-subunit alcohol dehydrogenase family)